MRRRKFISAAVGTVAAIATAGRLALQPELKAPVVDQPTFKYTLGIDWSTNKDGVEQLTYSLLKCTRQKGKTQIALIAQGTAEWSIESDEYQKLLNDYPAKVIEGIWNKQS